MSGGLYSSLLAILTSWSWEPNVLSGLAVAAGLYALGCLRLRSRGQGRAAPQTWRVWCYAAGLAALGLALLSPIDVFGSLFLFVHMVQHLLLMIVVPVLLWLGAPLLPVLWALPRALRRAVGGLVAPGGPLHAVFHLLTNPWLSALLYLIVIGTWHLPPLYNAAQGDGNPVHDLEHLMFLGAGLLYWWPVVHPSGGRRRLSGGGAVLYILAGASEGGLIGGALSFSDRVIYTAYLHVPRLWGLSALTDQQIGGIVMWLGGGLLNVGLAFALFVKMALDEERAVSERAF